MTETSAVSVEDLRSFLASPEEEADTGATIVHRADLGRAIVAAKDFLQVGEVVFRERPLMHWISDSSDDGGLYNFLSCFLEASPQVKAIAMDMHTPPIESEFMRTLRPTAVTLCREHSDFESLLGLDMVLKLIAVVRINAHEYYGKPADDFFEVISPSRRVGSGKSALFAYGSKIAHSCCANSTYSSKTADGCLEYKVVTPIKEGELITFPYIDVIPSNPTHLRRQDLMTCKAFFCECDLCKDLDYARAHWCPDCKNGNNGSPGRIVCVRPTEASDTKWMCTSCGPCDESCVEKVTRNEKFVGAKLNRLVMRLMLPGGASNVHPREANGLVGEAISALSNTHYLTLKCMAECSRLCASHAHGIQHLVTMGVLTHNAATPVGSLNTVRLQSANAGMEYIRGCECIASKCISGDQCNIMAVHEHPPVYSCAVSAFHAFVDLKETPRSLWPEGSSKFLLRYVPFCFAHFGPNDDDTQEMKSILTDADVAANVAKKPADVEKSTHVESPKKGTTGAGGGRRTNKKKNKGRKRK